MEANPYTGEVKVTWSGRPVTLRLRWREIATLRAKYGGEQDGGTTKWLAAMAAAVEAQDVDVLADMLAICSDLSKDEIMDISPGFVPVNSVLTELVMQANYGSEWEEKVKEDRTKEDGDAEVPLSSAIRSLLRWVSRQRSASPQPTSGS